MGALGVRAAGACARDAAQAQEPLGGPRVPQRSGERPEGDTGMAGGVSRVPRPVHGGDRHLRAGALALCDGERVLLARVAVGPARRCGRAHCLEERRGAVRRQALTLRVAVVAALWMVAASAEACDAPRGFTPRARVESEGVAVLFRTVPPDIEIGRHFSVEALV